MYLTHILLHFPVLLSVIQELLSSRDQFFVSLLKFTQPRQHPCPNSNYGKMQRC